MKLYNPKEPVDVEPLYDRYRWYTCKETKTPGHWVCAQETTLDDNTTRWVLVNVPKWMPTAVDFLFINNALKQKFAIVK